MNMAKAKLRKWDSAEHLQTEEDVAAYFDAVLEEAGDDPAFIAHALGVIARARGMSQLARDTGPCNPWRTRKTRTGQKTFMVQ